MASIRVAEEGKTSLNITFITLLFIHVIPSVPLIFWRKL